MSQSALSRKQQAALRASATERGDNLTLQLLDHIAVLEADYAWLLDLLTPRQMDECIGCDRPNGIHRRECRVAKLLRTPHPGAALVRARNEGREQAAACAVEAVVDEMTNAGCLDAATSAVAGNTAERILAMREPEEATDGK